IAARAVALEGGTFLGRPFVPKDDRKERRFSATYHGFDVHCAVRVAAGDDEGRERLVRYCARAPFALERLSELADGRLAVVFLGWWRARDRLYCILGGTRLRHETADDSACAGGFGDLRGRGGARGPGRGGGGRAADDHAPGAALRRERRGDQRHALG